MEEETEYESSRIERTKRGLYSPKALGLLKAEEGELSPSQLEVASDWGDTKIASIRPLPRERPVSSSLLKGLVITAVLTAVLSGGFFLYQLFDPFATPSLKHIDITIDAPIGASPGVPIDLHVRVTNQNRVPLEYANMSIVYPSGTRAPDASDSLAAPASKDLRDEKKVLGKIEVGQSVEYYTSAILLGEESTEKEILVRVEFRFEGVNSVLVKEEKRSVRMLSSPINLTVNMLKEVNAGQPLEISINAVSNTVVPLRDVLIKVEYPLGFTFTEANPKPTFGNNTWKVGAMNPTDKFLITIRGMLEGEDTQEKVFHTTAGALGGRTERDIETIYSKVLSPLTLMRPFIGIALTLNDEPASDVTIPFGQTVGGAVFWQNNLPTRIVNAQIEVKLRGVALDRKSITGGNGGFYRSSDDTIFWDERGDSSLAVLESGEVGTVTFAFKPLPPVSGGEILTNPIIAAEVSVRGKRYDDNGVPEEIKTVMSQNVKVTSRAQFAARSVYFVGPFVNMGPLPPKVEEETSYTIIWSIVNTSNTIANAEVRGTLPVYVKWARQVSPLNENVIYNPNTNEVIWSAGDIPAGVGISRPPKEVAFQVILSPSLSQVEQEPRLVTNIYFTAVDTFTNEQLREEKGSVSTNLPTDPKATGEMATVIP